MADTLSVYLVYVYVYVCMYLVYIVYRVTPGITTDHWLSPCPAQPGWPIVLEILEMFWDFILS